MILAALFMAFLSPFSTAEARLCSGSSQVVDNLVSDRLVKLEKAYVNTDKPVFFVGLWSRLEERDRRRVSHAISFTDPVQMTQELQGAMSAISARLSQDRHELVTWVTSHHLENELQVQAVPVDGSFLLVTASRAGLRTMICASASGELPAILTELGF